MTESRGGSSASDGSKEKKSPLDEEIGKDFLCSWKSMSVAEYDAMDFSFDTVSNGKKRFNFDKLDMDFDLGGDFDKLSSFKVDMSDLDFPGPSKKTAKPKETEEDPSSGNRQGKKDHFSFSFDFNDEDFANDAQSGAKFVGNPKSLIRELSDNEPFLLRSGKNCNKPSSISEGFNSDSMQNGSKQVGDLRLEHGQLTEEEPAVLGSEKNSREDLDASDVQMRSKLVDSKSLNGEVTEGEPVLVGIENNIKNLTDVREDTGSDGIQNEIKPVGDVRSRDKQMAKAKPFLPGNEKSTGKDFNPNDAQISNKLIGSESLPKELTIDEPVSVGSEKSAKSLSNIREVTNAHGVQNHSKVGNSRPQDKEAKIGEPVMLINEESSGKDFDLNDAQISNKLIGSESLSKELIKNETFSLGSEKNVKSLSTIREVINAYGVQNHNKVGNSRPQDKEATTRDLVMLRNEKSSGGVINADGVKNVSKGGNSRAQDTEAGTAEQFTLRNEKGSGFQVNPSSFNGKTTSTRASGNPKVVASSTHSFWNLKNVSVEGLKTGTRTPDLFSLKNLRTIGANKEMPSSVVLRQNNSLRNSEQTMKVPGITTSSIAHSIGGTQKQKPLIPSLKRKNIEESNADSVSLKPIKRLSMSPKESRNFRESLGRFIKEEVCNQENQGQSKTKNNFIDHSTSGIEVAWEVSMTELEIPLVMEEDRNVEKAESCIKEIEDICNMLKKKHEEAKEILVRAIVNNNNLLMLNHPICEEKIRMVQKFATELMCKEIPT